MSISPGRNAAERAGKPPPIPIEAELKSFVIPDFETIGLKTPPNARLCDPLVQVRSSRIVGTETYRSWSLMLAYGGVSNVVLPNVNEFGNAGRKRFGNSS